ncbi:unnamed protein product, partial [Laminaria digitata]
GAILHGDRLLRSDQASDEQTNQQTQKYEQIITFTKLLPHVLVYEPGPATVGQLQAAALSVRVFYQSANAVSCCIRLVFSLTGSTRQCCCCHRSGLFSQRRRTNANSLYKQ